MNIEFALQAMEKRGGSFVKGLAALYRKADAQNRERLRQAFEEYFWKYGKV